MNPSDVQSETEPEYFDPEEVDMSEQQFAASLEASVRSQFVVDDAEAQTFAGAKATLGCPPVVRGSVPDAVAPESAFGNDRRPTTDDTADSPRGVDSEADWRNLVSAKVNHYRSRKPYQERYPSLKLQFDPPVGSTHRGHEPPIIVQEEKQIVLPVEAPPVMSNPPRPISFEATARVIEFPRPAVLPRGDELAGPVVDRPRIMEAPELLPPPPAMGGILIEQADEPQPERRPGFDVPLQSAPLRRRVYSGIFDAALVVLALTAFGCVFLRINGSLPPLKLALEIAAGLLVSFWVSYQYAFMVFSGRTPGLWATRLHVSRFDGQPPSRSLRRWRTLASALSLASLGLGYAWCFLDEDQLSWHDRITKTHLAQN
jgi:uncharacterized RDD family membrane protein YckC